MSETLSKDYDWRTRVHYEQIFAEQCANALREVAKHAILETPEQRKEIAERTGDFFATCLNALYTGFKLYPDVLNGFQPLCHQSNNTRVTLPLSPEDREHQEPQLDR